MHDNSTKTYKKAENNQLNKIDDKAKTITEKLRIETFIALLRDCAIIIWRWGVLRLIRGGLNLNKSAG